MRSTAHASIEHRHAQMTGCRRSNCTRVGSQHPTVPPAQCQKSKNPHWAAFTLLILLGFWCRRDESNTRPSHYEFSPADKAKKYWKHSERKLLSLLKFPHSAVAVDATQPPAQRSMSVPELCHADRHAVPARSRGPPVPATNRDTA